MAAPSLRASGPIVLSCALVSAALRQLLLARGKRALVPWGPRRLALAIAQAVNKAVRLAGVEFECDTEEKWNGDPEKRLDPQRQYITPWHPHGALTFCAAFYTNIMTTQSTMPGAPGPRNWFVGIADLLFRFPGLGEALLLWNARPVSEATSQKVLKSGYSYAIQPGGIPEQVVTDHRRELLVFPPTGGFCRLAVQHGVPLVPIYAFGENQVFSTSGTGRRAVNRIYKTMGIAVPLIRPWPNPITVYMKWGRPVEVGPAEAKPSQERVQEVFGRYVKELARLFEEHHRTCLPADVAARGLTVMWRGHSKEELDVLLDGAGLERDQVPSLVTVSGQSAPPKLLQSRL
uniref:Acyltransferase n=1 Tax=Alexandrium catenella TaxID=2925 RepID=A0A7S1MSH1_ALECA